jgi:hypothetical protein
MLSGKIRLCRTNANPAERVAFIGSALLLPPFDTDGVEGSRSIGYKVEREAILFRAGRPEIGRIEGRSTGWPLG